MFWTISVLSIWDTIQWVLHLGQCKSDHDYSYRWILVFPGNYRKRHRKQTTYGGAWVDYWEITTGYSCTFFFKQYSPWLQQRSQSRFSYHTSCTRPSNCSRSQLLFGTEVTFCWKWCQGKWFSSRRRRQKCSPSRLSSIHRHQKSWPQQLTRRR